MTGAWGATPSCALRLARLGALLAAFGTLNQFACAEELERTLVTRQCRAEEPVVPTAVLRRWSAERVWPRVLFEVLGTSIPAPIVVDEVTLSGRTVQIWVHDTSGDAVAAYEALRSVLKASPAIVSDSVSLQPLVTRGQHSEGADTPSQLLSFKLDGRPSPGRLVNPVRCSEVDMALSDVNMIAAGFGVLIELFRPMEARHEDGLWYEPIDMRLSSTFAALARFVSEVEAHAAMIDFGPLVLARKGRDLQLRLTLRIARGRVAADVLRAGTGTHKPRLPDRARAATRDPFEPPKADQPAKL